MARGVVSQPLSCYVELMLCKHNQPHVTSRARAPLSPYLKSFGAFVVVLPDSHLPLVEPMVSCLKRDLCAQRSTHQKYRLHFAMAHHCCSSNPGSPTKEQSISGCFFCFEFNVSALIELYSYYKRTPTINHYQLLATYYLFNGAVSVILSVCRGCDVIFVIVSEMFVTHLSHFFVWYAVCLAYFRRADEVTRGREDN